MGPISNRYPTVPSNDTGGIAALYARSLRIEGHFRNVSSTASSGRGMTWALTSSPF
jgi:hypothetical protein